MTVITNHLPTAELQALDAAHHMHPFTANGELAEKGARIITRARGVTLTDERGQRRSSDAMAGLWCVNIGYGRDELGRCRRPPDARAALLQHLLSDHSYAGHRAGRKDRRTGAG